MILAVLLVACGSPDGPSPDDPGETPSDPTDEPSWTAPDTVPPAFDLSVDGVGYATSGGYLDDIVDQLEAFKAQIISGVITVPTAP